MTDLYDYHNGPNLGLEPTTPRQVTYQNGWPVPAGWKLVPCEPASRQVCYIAMEIQGVDEKGYCRFDDPRWSESVKTAERAYKAALEGAHEPPAAPQAEPSDDEWLRRLGELLGEYAEAVSFDSEDDIERAANAIHSHARALLARYGQPAASVEPVAQIYRKGFQHGSIVWTAAGLAADLPDGTSLYAAPVAAQAQPKRRPYNASASLSEYGIVPECDAAQGQPPANAGELPPMPAWMRETVRQALVHLHDAGIDQGSCDAALNWLAAQASGRAQAANADALDAARYRWLRNTLTNSVGGGVEVNDDALVYQKSEPGEEVRVYWYPDTPVGFYEVHGSTIDAAIDAAMSKEGKQ